MAKKRAKKPTEANWPTQYLVLWRTNLDDVPLLLTPDRRAATAYAKSPPQEDIDRAHEVMGIDHCGDCNTAIVTFRRGRPSRLRIL